MSPIRETPVTRARRALAGLAGSIADLLSEMSAGVARTPTATETDVWLARSRGLEEELDHVRPLVDEAVAFLRVDPFGRKTASTELSHALAALTHSVAQLRAIARTLFDHQIDGAPRLPASLAEVLSRTAVAYRAQAEALQGDAPSVDAALDAVRQARGESLRSLRRVDETGAWVVSGAILTEVDRMVAQLGGDAPALAVPSGAPRTVVAVEDRADGRDGARLSGTTTRENPERSPVYSADSSSTSDGRRPYRSQIGGFLEQSGLATQPPTGSEVSC